MSRARIDRLRTGNLQAVLAGGLKGIEKESLRVTSDGKISQRPHPEALGSALTHPLITTDYSEALLEFITPPFADARDTLLSLCDIHTFAYQHIGDELLWATSMPCIMGDDSMIPIAHYGSSNIGTMKHIYRRGLDYRYGRRMQAIAGVHYNYSLPEAFWPVWQELMRDNRSLQAFKSDVYFRLIRNFQRWGWLIPYLFGASPALCKSFFRQPRPDFQDFDSCTYYEPFATSLRMSDIGYKNKAQSGLKVSYGNLEAYVSSLLHAINTPDPDYAAIGIVVDDNYRQLNCNVLQIENEYYSFARPKNITRSGEKPALGLQRRGVEYVEIRALDVNAFEPMGVANAQMRFLEALLLLCTLEDSPPIGQGEQREIDHNQAVVARQGRLPGLTLQRHGQNVLLSDWATEICDALEDISEVLDASINTDTYRKALWVKREAIRDPEQTPSARILAEMRANRESFVAFAMRLSRQHQAYFMTRSLEPDTLARFDTAAKESLARQAELEATDTLSFEEYLERYLRQA